MSHLVEVECCDRVAVYYARDGSFAHDLRISSCTHSHFPSHSFTLVLVGCPSSFVSSPHINTHAYCATPALALTQILGLDPASANDECKGVALDVLLAISSAGPKIRTVLRESGAVRYVNAYLKQGGQCVDRAGDLLEALDDASA
jgi:hypothetical protein